MSDEEIHFEQQPSQPLLPSQLPPPFQPLPPSLLLLLPCQLLPWPSQPPPPSLLLLPCQLLPWPG